MNQKHPQKEQRPTEDWPFKQRSMHKPIEFQQASSSSRELTGDGSALISRSGVTQEKASLLCLCIG